MKLMFSAVVLSLFSLGIIPTNNNTDCDNVTITAGSGSITVSNLSSAAIAGIQVFNSSWATVFNQTYTSPPNTVVVSPIDPGQYFVKVTFYSNNWVPLCEKSANATVQAGSADTCSTTFQKSYGSPGNDEQALDITKTSDGGYVVAGEAASSGTSNYDALLVKFDRRGNLLWSKKYGGAQDDLFRRVRPTNDGGLLAAGQSKSFGNTNGDFWAVKTDASGNILWQKRYNIGSNPKYVFDMTSTSDGGFALIGDDPFTPGLSNWIILKADANGNVQWQKIIGTNVSDDGIGIVEDNHGGAGLVVTGFNWSNTTYDGNITKLNLSNGNVLWSKSFDLDGRTNRFGGIFVLSDGFLINGVNSDGFDATNPVHLEIKTDFNGNLIFAKEYRPSSTSWNGVSTPLPDGGFVLGINDDFITSGVNREIHLIRADASGNITWSKKYPEPGNQELSMIVNDGNFIVGVGFTTSGSYNDIFLIKSDLSGNMASCQTANESATTRNPVVSSGNWTWDNDFAGGNGASNTTSTATTLNLSTTIICADTCAAPLPTISMLDKEDGESVDTARIGVCLSAPTSQPVTVQYTTADGSAMAGSDYVARSGSVTIPAGALCASINIALVNDAVSEPQEYFVVNISNPTNATIADGTGIVTITDDDQPQFNCNAVTITPGNNQINFTGITAPIATIQVFNSSWATVFNQTYTGGPGNVTVNIGPGSYHVKVTFYNNNWTFICDKNQDVTVINQCPPGATCLFNVCPSQTVNLNDAYSIPNLPAGTVVSWHTGTPATDANKMTPTQAQNVSVSGTYYAAINITGAGCYSNTIPVNVTINPCNSSLTTLGGLEVKTADTRTGRKIMVAPNPFTSTVRVMIDSEIKEKTNLVLTDLMGRTLQIIPVQLVPGSNQVTVGGLERYPSGSYFLKVASAGSVQTFKLLRQQ